MSIILSTGNVSHARKNHMQDAVHDLRQRIKQWRQDEQSTTTFFGPNTNIEIPANPKEPLFCDDIPKHVEVKGKLETTVKLFFSSIQTSISGSVSVRASILERALTKLVATMPNQNTIKHLVLSFPEISFADNDEEEDEDLLDNSAVKQDNLDIWAVAASMMEEYKIESLGVSEFSTARLQSLMAFCKAKNLPLPVINQINIRDCCVLPPSLVTLAKENNIKLLAHNDPINILPEDAVNELVASIKGDQLSAEEQSWNWEWLTKTTAIVASRGIVCGLGWALELDYNI
ncbi:hypothetical protein V1512DRAFT_260205 [Lipomyces arxii]|uniref:uncharacterized protein n=1 Tax=Lipomyces arxii TaxID=56418 RepID=UPI0034CDBE3B